MRIAIYLGTNELGRDPRFCDLYDQLEKGGVSLFFVDDETPLEKDSADMLMSVGGDGTFLFASMMVYHIGIPVVGVNLGRLGFLSENRPEDVAHALLSGEYSLEDRLMLKADASWLPPGTHALNEFTVHRNGAALLAVDLTIDGIPLPTYWADGLIVSTSSGSTAYSLSAGGPIVLPDSRVLLITPIAPHNMNVRPLVVPDSAKINVRVHSRDGNVKFTADNRTYDVCDGASVDVSMAQFSLKRIRLDKSDFINALTEKLYWGEDVRNIR